MYYTYILFDKKRFYSGYTNSLKRRVREHTNQKVKSTSNRKNLKLIFYEAFVAKKDAERREQYFKTTKGKRALRFMLKETLKSQP